jgi:hypothetical protein
MKPAYILPTAYKAKIPHTLSYPVGAERISEALQDVPQMQTLSISFVYYKQEQRLLDRTGLHQVMAALYRKSRPTLSSSNAMIDGGWYRPKWQITVSPVPREIKHTVMDLLVAEGLPRVRAWLLARGTLIDEEGYQRISLFFSSQSGMLQAEEYSGA